MELSLERFERWNFLLNGSKDGTASERFEIKIKLSLNSLKDGIFCETIRKMEL